MARCRRFCSTAILLAYVFRLSGVVYLTKPRNLLALLSLLFSSAATFSGPATSLDLSLVGWEFLGFAVAFSGLGGDFPSLDGDPSWLGGDFF